MWVEVSLKNDCPDKAKATPVRANTCQVQLPGIVANTHTANVGETVVQPVRYVDAEVQVCVESECNDVSVLQTQAVVDNFIDNSQLLDNAYAKLQYIDVQIADPDYCNVKAVSALCDSGAEVSVIRADILGQLDIPRVGHVKLRGIVGSPVSADLVKLDVALLIPDHVENEYVSIVCAVCSEMNDDFVLTAEVVNNLFSKQPQVFNVNIDILPNDDNDNNCDMNNVTEVSNDTNTDAVSSDIVDDHNRSVSSDGCQTSDVLQDVSDATRADNQVPNQGKANAETIRQEQIEDDTLKGWWSLAGRNKGDLFIKDGILYHAERILGQDFVQLCLPQSRRSQVLELAHDTFGGHLGEKRTRERIRLSFTWPTLTSDCKKYCQTCVNCQKRARRTYLDRVPITPIPRAEAPFTHWFMDCCLGPIFSYKAEYNYCLVIVDSATRWPAAFPLKSLTAKGVCDALLQLWMVTGIPNTVSSDNATNFTSKLNQEFLKRMGCSPRFNTPGHPQSSGLVERMVGTIKNMINKVAFDHPKQWHKYLGYILWALREVPNESTGVPPWVMTFGHLPRGPLAVLKETWIGETDIPLDLGKNVVDFMHDLRDKLTVAQDYAKSHCERAQARYTSHYNLRSKDKHFTVGEQVLVLSPESTASKVYSRWKGPAKVVEVKSPYSYIVELDDGRRQHIHANKLRKFNVRVDEVVLDGEISNPTVAVDTCAIIYDNDVDFGSVAVVDPPVKAPDKTEELSPSKRIDPTKLAHLSEKQRIELTAILDQFQDCFADVPGFCDLVEHEIPISDDFKPKRFRAYKVPERLKAEVDRQIQELLSLGFIRPSKSQMASPLVCVLKGKDGKDGVRLAVDYRYVNKFTKGDAFPIPDVADCLSRMGPAGYTEPNSG